MAEKGQKDFEIGREAFLSDSKVSKTTLLIYRI